MRAHCNKKIVVIPCNAPGALQHLSWFICSIIFFLVKKDFSLFICLLHVCVMNYHICDISHLFTTYDSLHCAFMFLLCIITVISWIFPLLLSVLLLLNYTYLLLSFLTIITYLWLSCSVPRFCPLQMVQCIFCFWWGLVFKWIYREEDQLYRGTWPSEKGTTGHQQYPQM